MITILCVLYALGVGIMGTLMFVNDAVHTGLGGRGEPLWRLLLPAFIWPAFLFNYLRLKFMRF